ncbi:MAG: prenyltransferase/squalene oxidase repeat-containing protein, partial [Planctomycetota bacterium]
LLVVALLASLSLVLTMLATRWGDRNTSFKSLMAARLLHGVCLLGLEVFDPTRSRSPRSDSVELPQPEIVMDVLPESDRQIPLPGAGNMALADLPSKPEIELQRLESMSPEITRTKLPERVPEELESLSTNPKDVTQFEERPMVELAAPSDSGQLGPKRVGAEDPEADVQAAFEKNTADVFMPKTTRTQPRLGSLQDQNRIDDPTRPLAAPELRFDEPDQDLAMNLATDSATVVELPPVKEDPNEFVESRSAPIPAAEASDGSVMTQNSLKSGAAAAASTFQSRLPRPSRMAPDRTPAERQSRITPDIARTNTPLSDDYDDVRIGDIAPNFSEAISSAAPEMDADLPSIQRRENPPAAYQLRNVQVRRDAALQFGGTKESETAVERSLRWLAANQNSEGYWSAEKYGAGQLEKDENGREFVGRGADTGLTALIVLSFLGAGYTHEGGRYASDLDRALDWLIRQQGEDGNLCGDAEVYGRMYCHAMATYAMAEAYGMQQDEILGPIIEPDLLSLPSEIAILGGARVAGAVTAQPGLILAFAEDNPRRQAVEEFAYSLRRVDDLRLRSALSKAVSFTIGMQDPRSGGWRYRKLQEGDVSIFGWHMMSLKSAELAGVSVPSRVLNRMQDFLQTVKQGQHGGLFGYRRNVVRNGRDTEPVTPAMTAEALFCQQMLGYPRESEASRESVDFLMRNSPRLSEMNFYYWYYGTLAMYQFGGQPWQDWNVAVRDLLVSEQVQNGSESGSWDPNDRWGRSGGRLYSTALATLTLEVYYRFLPLYRINEAAPDRR